MKKANVFILGAFLATGTMFSFTGCKKQGCTDTNANNYNEEAKKDDGTCTYPQINLNSAGDGDVTGNGGSNSVTHNWENAQSTAEYNMDITASSGGSFQLIIKDADEKEVSNQTLTVGVGDDSKSGCSSSGTPGTWTVTVKLTDFSGDGSFSLSQNC